MDLLFKNATVLTMDDAFPVVTGADVGIENGKIVFVRKRGASSDEIKSKRIIDGAGKVLMPGLYNCHTHASMSLLRGFANDLALEDWLFNHIFPAEKKLTPRIVYTGTMLAIAEMVASGTVAFTDMYFFMDEVARAAHDSGVLANVCNAVIGLDKNSYDFYEDKVCEQTKRVVEDYHKKGDGRIKAEASIHSVYTSYAPAWRQVLEFAGKHGLDLHIHLSETAVENANCMAAYGMTPAMVFERHGVLEKTAVAGHGVHLTDEDLDVLAERNVSVAHCPVSNL
ncbi:MAG: amidohydrolase family protein, partial [Defluviitaleaceae bacterium]|nr:amidohydrolase family protein [Defluviitaleaceae bacterium]